MSTQTDTNNVGAFIHFDLCMDDGSHTALMGDSGEGATWTIGTAEEVSCSGDELASESDSMPPPKPTGIMNPTGVANHTGPPNHTGPTGGPPRGTGSPPLGTGSPNADCPDGVGPPGGNMAGKKPNQSMTGDKPHQTGAGGPDDNFDAEEDDCE